ncbi:MAG TPA: hypothetical protein VFZ16_17070 [Hyphomicrobiaceae bacterium]|nr:hypothetical protein [Hyphomicrobiaceae bacterium]
MTTASDSLLLPQAMAPAGEESNANCWWRPSRYLLQLDIATSGQPSQWQRLTLSQREASFVAASVHSTQQRGARRRGDSSARMLPPLIRWFRQTGLWMTFADAGEPRL